MIHAVAMKKGESSLIIFYEQPGVPGKPREIISFEASKQQIWDQLEGLGLTSKQKN